MQIYLVRKSNVNFHKMSSIFPHKMYFENICEILAKLTKDQKVNIDGLVQERLNSIANTLELRLSCTNPSDAFVQERRNAIANALELRLSCTNPSI